MRARNTAKAKTTALLNTGSINISSSRKSDEARLEPST